MLRGLRLVFHSRCYLSTGVSMLVRNTLRKSSRDEVDMTSLCEIEDGNLRTTKCKRLPQLNSSKTRESPKTKSEASGLFGWYGKPNTVDSKRILRELEQTHTFINEQEWKSALIKYLSLSYPLVHRHEIQGNAAVCALQINSLYVAKVCAEDAVDVHPGRMVYYELIAQALIKQKRYSKALEACDRGLSIDSKILEADDSDIEELKKLKQHCIEKMNAGLDDSLADDYPFRQFFQGFISQDAWENIAASAYQSPLFTKPWEVSI